MQEHLLEALDPKPACGLHDVKDAQAATVSCLLIYAVTVSKDVLLE